MPGSVYLVDFFSGRTADGAFVGNIAKKRVAADAADGKIALGQIFAGL
jgi:hypothetical protein